MRIFRNLDEFPTDWQPTVISIGNFDGVHRAHQHVLGKVAERARALNAHSLAVTFDPHPARLLRPENAPRLITPLPQKLELLSQTGVEATLILPFDAKFSSLSPHDFARQIVVERLHAREIQEGASFRFGHQARGNVERLAEYGRELGFSVVIYPEMRLRGDVVSSSAIRRLLSEGQVSRARHLLGRPFSITGTPAPGRGYGSRYTVPTINLAAYNELAPRHGVYVTCTRVGNERFESVTNVGTRPTFGEASFAIETHLLNFHPIALDESATIEIAFLKWLRPEIKWPNPEALKAQIGKDVKRSQRFWTLTKTNSSSLTTDSTDAHGLSRINY
jgi:riboflavin kinase/FMN adenylyltransferase